MRDLEGYTISAIDGTLRDPLRYSTRQFVGEQSGVLLFDHRIALAAAPFQPFAVEHGDVAARVPDQPGVLLRFPRDHRIRLAVVFTAFGVSDNEPGGARVLQHLGAQIAGKCSGDFGGAVLPADSKLAGGYLYCARDQRRWGQIKISAAGGAVRTAAAISPSCGAVPCIFQFPAIKGRTAA
jgi:hypothetical protein